MGNPPYVRQELIGEFKNYFENNYKVYHGIADLYSYFIERAVTLLKEGGYFSYIVANKWMRANYGEPLRIWMKNQNLIEIVDFGDLPVFKGATTYPCIINISRGKVNDEIKVVEIKSLEFNSLVEVVIETAFRIKTSGLNDSGWNLVMTETKIILEKLFKKGVPLEKYVNGKIFYGIKTGLNKAFVIDEETKNRLINEDPKSAEIIKPFLAGRDIKRYHRIGADKYLILFPKGFTNLKSNNSKSGWTWLVSNYPAIASRLKQFEEESKKRYDKGEYWWELRACDYYDEFEKPKIILPDISLKGNYTLDSKGGLYCGNTAYIIGSTEKCLLGILNSNLMNFYYASLSSSYRGGYLRFIYQYLAQLPIVVVDNKGISEQLDKLVGQNLILHKKVSTIKTPTERTAIERQIQATDKQIDQLVYKLYELTDEEIKIVEAGGRQKYLKLRGSGIMIYGFK